MDQFWTYNLLTSVLQYKATAVFIMLAVVGDFIVKFVQAEQYFSVKEKIFFAAVKALIKFVAMVMAVILIAIALEVLTYFFGWISSGTKW